VSGDSQPFVFANFCSLFLFLSLSLSLFLPPRGNVNCTFPRGVGGISYFYFKRAKCDPRPGKIREGKLEIVSFEKVSLEKMDSFRRCVG